MKYAGSKAKIAKYIIPIIQKCIDDNNLTVYMEPFVGGANVIDKVRCQSRYGSDKNKYLIALFNHLQDGGELLPEVPRELYSEVRANYRSDIYEDWYVGNIGFLASYNGRWFDGGYAQAGYVKTKTGQVWREYYRETSNNIIAQIPALLDVPLEVKDYRDVQPVANSLIYCDPPYANTKQFSYSKGFDTAEFWEKMREWSKDNFVLISEVDAPDDFICIWEKKVSRNLNAAAKGTAIEKLFAYKYGKYAEYIKKERLL